MSTQMQARLMMIEAIEEKDDAKLAILLARYNDRFENYAALVHRYSAYQGGDLVVLNKLLDFPGIDQTSHYYQSAVLGAFNYLSANHEDGDIKPGLLEALFEKFKHRAEAKDTSLRLIFDCAARPGYQRVSIRAAKLLAAHGADCDGAAAFPESRLQHEIKYAREKLKTVAALKAAVKKK